MPLDYCFSFMHVKFMWCTQPVHIYSVQPVCIYRLGFILCVWPNVSFSLERSGAGPCGPPPSCCSRCPGCFYKYRPDIINPTFHCAAFLRVALPYQMLSFYGAERASKALYDFKSVVKYFQEAHIKEISSCDRLCWLCKGTKHKEQLCFSAYLLSDRIYWAVCAWLGAGLLNEFNQYQYKCTAGCCLHICAENTEKLQVDVSVMKLTLAVDQQQRLPN